MLSVEDEWDRDPEAEEVEDLLFVVYDADTITVEELLDAIAEEGFKARVKTE
ncbi:MAG: hypothetical protein KY476_27290 [Planctomycetes bacterium]|nr:hypothetical protein [Planctomycetota bacterium]